jgi:hypothetical protein
MATIASVVLGVAVAATGCAGAETDQPSVAPAVRSSQVVTTGTSRTSTTSETPPVSGKPAVTAPTSERVPGPPIGAATGSGRDITSDELASIVPGPVLQEVADITTSTSGDVSVRFYADVRDRRSTTNKIDQPIIVDDAVANGWIAGLDAIATPLGGRGRRASVTVELFASPSGASAYAGREAPYWNPKPSTLEEFDTPEFPGSRSYRVLQTAISPAITQINVPRGPAYLKVAVYDEIDFVPESIDQAVDVMRAAIASIDGICGAKCSGTKGLLATPPFGVAPETTCLNAVASALPSLAIPKSQFVVATCSDAHDAELVGAVGTPYRSFPTSLDEAIAKLGPANNACFAALTKRQPKATADGQNRQIDLLAVTPTAAEFDAGQKSTICLVTSIGPPFQERYLP